MIVNPVVQSGGDIEYEIINGPAKGSPASAKAGDSVMSKTSILDLTDIIAQNGNEVPHGFAYSLARAPEPSPYFVMPAQSVTIS